MNIKLLSGLCLVLVVAALFSPAVLAETYAEEEMVVDYIDGKISIRASNAFLADLFDEIYYAADVEFQYDQDTIPEKIKSVKIDQQDLRSGIKALLQQAGIKNYSFQTDGEGTTVAVEILANMKSESAPDPADSTAKKQREQNAQQPEYKEEEYTDLGEEEGPIFTRRERYIHPEEEKPVVTEEPAVAAEEETTVSEAEPAPQKIFNVIGYYGEQESTEAKRSSPEKEERQTYTSPLPDMSDQYRPPGAPQKKTEDENTTQEQEGPLPDMSDQYHPPGTK